MVLRRTLHICWWMVAVVIVTLAVALSAARLLLPGMSHYREQVETVAAEVFKRPVTIGSLDAAWRGISPVLKLDSVVVSDPRLPHGRIAIDEVEVKVDVIESLLQGRLRTAGVKVIGARLEIETDIRHRLESLPLQVVVQWLLGQGSIALEKVQLLWRDPGLFDTPIRLTDLSANLVNTGQRHQLLLDAKLPMWLGETLKVAADFHGRNDDPGNWRGTLYLKTRDLQLGGFRPAMADSGLVARGAVNLETWVGVAHARPVWGSGSLDWQNPSIHNASADAQGISADGMSMKFHWRQRNDRWRIGLRGFELRRDRHPVWPASDFDFLVQNDQQLRLQGKASLVVLEELNSVLPLLPWVDDNALSMLDRLQPSGVMRKAEFEFAYRAGETPRFAMRSAIENLSLAANGGLPGVTGVSGRIEGNLRSGNLRLATSRAELVMPRVFSRPLALTGVSGDVHWQRFDDRFRIGTEKLRVESGPLALDSRWQLDWRYDQASPWLDLQLAADPLPLAATRKYLPAGLMPPHAVSWLQNAFLAGTASNIRVLLQGRLDQLPFDASQGRFEARFDFEDVHLAYHPDWGELEDLNGQAVFNGRSMRIVGRSGRIQDSPVERAVAVIKDLNVPILEVDGTVDGTLAGMLAYVRSSPLKQHFGALVDNLDSSGDARLQLRLDIPLKHGLGEPRVKGDVILEGNDLLPRGGEIGLTDIRGTLHFSHSGVSVTNAKARVLKQPVVVSVYQRREDTAPITVVDIQGRLKIVDFLRKKALPLASDLDGGASWQALLKIQDQAQPDVPRVAMELHSDLQGVAVKLPPPFAKQTDEKRPLSIGWVPDKQIARAVWITYGDLVKARLLLGSDQRLRKAAIHAGDSLPALPAQEELHVSGRLPVFDLGEWLPVFEALDKRKTGGARGLPPSLDLGADVFRFGGAQTENITAHSKYTDPRYFQLDGEGAKGWLRWIRGGRDLPAQLLAKLDYLNINTPSESRPTPPSSDSVPTELPKLNIEIGDLRWGQRDLGQLNIVSQRIPAGTHFTTIKLASPAITFDGSGDWLLRNGSQLSRFSAKISDGDLGKLSEWFGSSGAIKGGKLSGSMQLSWPGSPATFSLTKMEGEFDLKARDGRLEKVDEGAGKLLSLFSLNSLQRRLSLDFRDVVKEGFSFDVMKGNFVVMDGDAFTDDFAINGTSVNIDISGRTGLVARDYDQLVTVTPQVTSTLPIAGAIAGGPAVGAAVFLADKLMGDSFNRLTQVKYHVTGSWDKPVYSKLKKEERKKQPRNPDDDM